MADSSDGRDERDLQLKGPKLNMRLNAKFQVSNSKLANFSLATFSLMLSRSNLYRPRRSHKRRERERERGRERPKRITCADLFKRLASRMIDKGSEITFR